MGCQQYAVSVDPFVTVRQAVRIEPADGEGQRLDVLGILVPMQVTELASGRVRGIRIRWLICVVPRHSSHRIRGGDPSVSSSPVSVEQERDARSRWCGAGSWSGGDP